MYKLLFVFSMYLISETGDENPPVRKSVLSVADYTAQQWRAIDIQLTSKKNYAKPFYDVEVNARFVGPDGETIIRPAFWDGGKTWIIRFAAPKTGRWQVEISCSDKTNKGLNNLKKTVDCVPYTGALEIYKHGFIKLSENKRYFAYNDGTPFFYLGDTHWLFIHERFDTANRKGVASQFKYIVDKRVQHGFTVYQSEAIQHPHTQNTASGGAAHTGKDEEPHCNLRDGFDERDIPGWRNIDQKFRYIADQGLLHANSAICWALDPAEFPEAYSVSYMTRLARYWAARYGAYPVLWTVAQEIDRNMYGHYDSVSIEKWYAVAEALETFDGYHHPLTAHMENVAVTRAADSWWSDKPFHSWWGVQWQENLHTPFMQIGREFRTRKDTKPSVLYESAYEGFWTDARGARSAGYKAFQLGMCGYGYGANGIWNDLYSKDPPDYGTDYEMPVRYMNWFDGVHLPGAEQLRHMKKFYTGLEWWKLVPRFDDPEWADLADRQEAFLSSDGQQTFVLYFDNKTWATGRLKKLVAKQWYIAQWYNPRNGEFTHIGSFTTADGYWIIPDKPDSEDWLLYVTLKTGSNVK